MQESTTVVSPPDKTIVVDGGSRGAYGPQWSAEPTFGQTANAVHVANGDMHLLNALLTQFGFTREGIANQGSDTREAVRQEGRHLSEEVCDHRRETEAGFGDTRREIAKEFGFTNLNVDKTVNAARAELAASMADGKVANVIGFKDARYDACVNAAAIAKQLAECCCELKEKISAEGQATRDLIAANETNALRSQVTELKTAALIAASVQVGPLGGAR